MAEGVCEKTQPKTLSRKYRTVPEFAEDKSCYYDWVQRRSSRWRGGVRRTEMALGKLNVGQVRAVLFDEEGSQNVPAGAANDGPDVLSVARAARHWRIAIRKGKL